MAGSIVSVENIKDFYNNQVHNPSKWDMNKKLLRAVGLFAGSIVFMRSFGDLMAI